MKIGYFVGHFPFKDFFDNIAKYIKRYSYDGGINVAYNLALNMAKRGHEINVFTTSIDRKDTFEKHENIEIYRYRTNFRIGSGNFSFNLFLKPKRHKVDIIHTHVGNPIADLAGYVYMKRNRNIPFIITYHGDGQEDIGSFIRNTGVSFYNKHLLDKVLSRADVIICPSEYYIHESRFLGKYTDKIIVIPNGINLRDFDIPYSKEECRVRLGLPIDENIILFVGSLTPYKGPDVLVKAMVRILKKVPDVELVFVGSGGMKTKLEKLSKRLDVKKHVKFAGFIGGNLKPIYYRASDVFCLPSTMNTEVFPIVLLEASASGLPMVVSDLDTFKCIIEESYNGLFSKRGDEKSLANVIIYLLENEDIRKKMGKNGRKKVKDYSWKRIAQITEKVYRKVIV